MGRHNRDDFSELIKRKAAQRTGYRCSKCFRPTIGPSYESNEAVSNIGEAAHICAAAPGGKRYNPAMTPEERSSIENCIWLCKIHARQIDTDDVTYTVPVLVEMKKRAEKYAETSISELDMFRNCYNSNGDNISSLHTNFFKMVGDGNFDLLRNVLESYTASISPIYDEFVLRFKLIYDLYCDHLMIEKHANDYIALPNHDGADELLMIAIPLNQKVLVERLIPFSSDLELKKLSKLLIEDSLERCLMSPKAESSHAFEVSKEKENLINNYIVQRAIDKNVFCLKRADDTDVELKSEEYYYMLLFAAFKLNEKAIYKGADIVNDAANLGFWTLVQNIKMISQLDAKLQDFLWESMLQFSFEDKERFCDLLKSIPFCAIDMPRITKIKWLYKIRYESSSIDVDKLLAYSKGNDNYVLLSKYLRGIPEESRYEFVKDHLYLCKKSSRFLQMVLEYDRKHDISTVDLNHYTNDFESDFLYHCLRYSNAVDAEEKEGIVQWLLGHHHLLMMEDLYGYLEILAKENKWDNILELATYNIQSEHLFHIANLLTSTKNTAYIDKGIRIYNDLEELGWNQRGFFFNIGVVSANSGRTEKAKKYFQKEFDLYQDETALYHLLCLRIDTNDVLDDLYLHKAKNIVARDFQNIAAASYEKMMDHEQAKLYVLRTLLLDDMSRCIGALYSLSLEEDEVDPDCVQNDVVCVLRSELGDVNVAIHNPGVLDNVTPNNFANCVHYTVGDAEISPLMYCKRNDVITFKNNSYLIADIVTTSRFFSAFALRQIVLRDEGIRTISGKTPEEALSKLIACLVEVKEKTDTVLTDYNAAQIRYPISILSALLGKNRLEVCEFIALGNKEKVRNNLSVVESSEEATYILAFDSIVNLAIISFYNLLPKNIKLLCPHQVKKQLMSEISEMLSDLNSKKTVGSMYVVDDRPIFNERTSEFKRDRYAFLASINDFLASLPDVEAYDLEDDNSALLSLLGERKMEIEVGALSLMQNIDNAILVTDDQFLYSVAAALGQKSIGLCGFVSNVCKDGRALLDFSKGLKSINFANYIPLILFEKIIDSISNMTVKEECDALNNALAEWLMCDKGNDATDYHREIVLQLYRDCVAQTGTPLPTDYPLTRIAIHHFAKMNPEYVKKLVEELAKNILWDGEGKEDGMV